MSTRIAVSLVFAAAVIAACSDDPSSIGTPQSLTISAGNNQTGTPGQALAQPLEVRVIDADDQPYEGVNVHWTVMSGDGRVEPASSMSNEIGVAGTTLTLGESPGEVLIEAVADGLSAVSFKATGMAECGTIELVVGASIDATLTDEDCQRSTGSASHHYTLNVDEPLSLQLTQTSSALDAYLEVTDASGALIAFNDDVSNSDPTSALRAFLAPGQYVVVASGSDPEDIGDYSLSTAIEESAVTNCLFNVWTVRTSAIVQDLSASDCSLSDSGGNVYYADPYLMYLSEGDSFTATEASAEWTPYLELYAMTADGFVYIGYDDASGDDDAQITYTAPVTGVYLLLPSSLGGGETGTYTLTVE